MGDVKVKEVRGVEPITIDEIRKIGEIDPLRIEKVAPTAIHVKELNHIDPISVESLRIDQVRNLDPVRVERFDVTHLPTVNLSLGQIPSLDLSLRRVPPLAVGVHQDFEMPSEYHIRARLLGLEFLRVHVTGRSVIRPRDHARREATATHERSFPEVAAVGNPALPVETVGERAEAHRPPARAAVRPPRHRARPVATLSLREPSPSHGESGMSGG